MGTATILQKINAYFQDNWADTEIQLEGKVLNTSELDKWISLTYDPSSNSLIGLDGSGCGRIDYEGLWKVFCYAKNPTRAYLLADDVKAFFNGKEIDTVRVEFGQDGKANPLDNGWYETLCTFKVVNTQ